MNVADAELGRLASSAAVDRLVREHHNIEVLLLMLDSYFAAMEAGEDVDEALLLDVMSYMTEFVDGFHHAKEELALEAVSGRSAAIDRAREELEAQHRRIAEAGSRLRSALVRALRDEPVSRRELTAWGFGYTADMRRNMELEETVVFPALAEVLDPEAWRRIDAKVGKRPDPLFGETVHQRYALLFRELAGRFGCEEEARFE